MKVKIVLNGCVLVRPRPAEAVAGIEIPESVDQERATIGTVVIGNFLKVSQIATPGKTVTDLDCWPALPGQIVLFHALAPRKVEHEGEECLLVGGEDILAIIEE